MTPPASSKNILVFARTLACIFLALTLAALYLGRDFRIDASADSLLTEDNEHFIRSQQAGLRYSPDEFILIAFQPANVDLGESVFADNNLQVLNEISQKIEKINRVEKVQSIVNVPIFLGADTFSTDIDPNSLTWRNKKYNEAFLSKSLANHPLYENLLVNEEQTALSLNVVFKPNSKLVEVNEEIIKIQAHLLTRELNSNERDTLTAFKNQRDDLNRSLETTRKREIEEIRAIVQDYNSAGNFYMGGNNLLSYQLIEIIKNDLVVFGIAILLIVCALLYTIFRSHRWVWIPVICCISSVSITVGLLALLGIKVTVISANVAALQIILTLALIIHLITHYQELKENTSTASAEDSFRCDILKTIKHKFKPCFYASLTTSVGFASLIFSGVQPVINFGWMMVLAMCVTLVVGLVFFPAVIIALFRTEPSSPSHKKLKGFLKHIATYIITNSKTTVVITMVLAGIFLAGTARLSAENSFLDYFSDSTNVHKELSYIDTEFGGTTALDILYNIPQSQTKEGLTITADAVQIVEKIQQKLMQKQAIGSVTSIADFTRIAQVVQGKPLTEYEVTALYLALDDSLRTQLFGPYFSEDLNQIRITSRVKDTTEGLDRSALLEDVHKDIQSLGIKPSEYQLTNVFVLYEDILRQLVKSQVLTLGLVYLAMAVVLLLVFSSLRIALIALVPNAMTTLFILGFMGIAGIPLDLMTITIASIAMGISVDDTIHYIHRYLQELNASDNPIVKTHQSIGSALVYTSAVIFIGFGALFFSDFVPSVYFGLLTGLAMVVALITDMTILPVLLKKWVK